MQLPVLWWPRAILYSLQQKEPEGQRLCPCCAAAGAAPRLQVLNEQAALLMLAPNPKLWL